MNKPAGTLKKDNRQKKKRESVSDVFPKTWPLWVHKGLNWLGQAEKYAIQEFALDDDCPRWVVMMMVEIFRVTGLGVRIEDDQQSGPAFLAAIVGHTEVLLKSATTGISKALEVLEKKDRELRQKILGTLTKHQMAFWVKEQRTKQDEIRALKEKARRFLDIFSVVGDRKLKICERIVAEAGKLRDQGEKDEFFESYSRARKRKIFNDEGRYHHEKPTHEPVTPSTIYALMVMNWRTVDEFKNFGELRAWFEKRFGAGRVGNEDRLKHLCQHHGYNPGAPAGRPVGSVKKTPQIPTVLSDYILQSDLRRWKSKANK